MNRTRTNAASPGRLAVEATRSSIWSVAGQFAQVAMGLISFVVLSRILTPADYGMLSMAATVQGFLGVVGDSGMVAAVMRARVIDERLEATAFWAALAGAAVLAAVSAATSPLLAWFYHEPAVTPLALGLSVTFLLAAPARVSTAKLAKRLAFRALASISLVANLAGLAAAWALAHTGAGAWALVSQTALTFAIQTLLLLAAAPICVRPRAASRKLMRELAMFSSRMSAFVLSATAARAADPLLGGRFLGADAVGLLSMGQKLAVVPVQRISSAVSNVFMPMVLRLADERHGEAFHAAVRLTSLVTIPVSLGIYAIAPEIIALLPARWAGLEAPLRICALGTLVEPLGWYAFAAASARGRPEALLQVGVALMPIGWAAAFAGALSGRVAWLVAAGVSVNAVGAAMVLKTVWRQFGLGWQLWRALAIPHLLGAAMVVAVRLSLWTVGLEGRRLGAAVGIAVGVAAYGALVLAFERAEARRFLDLMGRAVRRRG